jgi:hypothetical protein
MSRGSKGRTLLRRSPSLTFVVPALCQRLDTGYRIGYFHFPLQHSKRVEARRILRVVNTGTTLLLHSMSLWVLLDGRWREQVVKRRDNDGSFAVNV